MHGEIDFLVEKGTFQLLDEHACAPVRTRLIGRLCAVAAGGDGYHFDLEARMRLSQCGGDQVALCTCKRARPSSETNHARTSLGRELTPSQTASSPRTTLAS